MSRCVHLIAETTGKATETKSFPCTRDNTLGLSHERCPDRVVVFHRRMFQRREKLPAQSALK